MRIASFGGLLLALGCFGTQAQNLYRCGNEYRDTPCPGAVSVDARDPRTPAEKKLSDQQVSKDAELAEQMEKARLQSQAQADKRLQEQAKLQAVQTKAAQQAANAAAKPAEQDKVLKPHKQNHGDVFTVRSAKPPKKSASASAAAK